MSLIALREIVRRQGQRAVATLVVLVAALVVAHHAGLHDANVGEAGTTHAAMQHADTSPDAPVSSEEEMITVCLAVLPLTLALALGLGATVLLRRRWQWRPQTCFFAAPLVPSGGFSPLGSPRAGPRVLCVMRC